MSNPRSPSITPPPRSPASSVGNTTDDWDLDRPPSCELMIDGYGVIGCSQRWPVEFVTHHVNTEHQRVVLVVSHDQRHYVCKLEVITPRHAKVGGRGWEIMARRYKFRRYDLLTITKVMGDEVNAFEVDIKRYDQS